MGCETSSFGAWRGVAWRGRAGRGNCIRQAGRQASACSTKLSDLHPPATTSCLLPQGLLHPDIEVHVGVVGPAKAGSANFLHALDFDHTVKEGGACAARARAQPAAGLERVPHGAGGWR